MKRLMLMLLSTTLLFGTALAQEEGGEDLVRGDDFDVTSVQPIGVVEVGTETYDTEDQLGALVLTHTTPDQQHANFDVVGPDGFFEHFEFEDADEGEMVLDAILPGVYSIAATDDGLGLAHTIVEVAVGETTTVNVTLEPWDEAVATEEFDAATTYGTYEGFEDAQPGYPFGAYDVGIDPLDDAPDSGAIFVQGLEGDNAQLVVTGPNGFSETADNEETISGLVPGRYVLAATADGAETSVTTIQVSAGERFSIDPNFALLSQGGQDQGQGQDGQMQGQEDPAAEEQQQDDGQQTDGQQNGGQQTEGQQEGGQQDGGEGEGE